MEDVEIDLNPEFPWGGSRAKRLWLVRLGERQREVEIVVESEGVGEVG